MFSPFMRLCTFVGYYNSGGKDELHQIFRSMFHAQTTISNDSYIESAGRVLAIMCQALLASVAGGIVFDAVIWKIMMTEGLPHSIRQAIVWLLVALSLIGLRMFGTGFPHTTRFTRRCVGLVEQLAPDTMRQREVSIQTPAVSNSEISLEGRCGAASASGDRGERSVDRQTYYRGR